MLKVTSIFSFVQDNLFGETDMEKGYDRVFWKIEMQQKKVNRMRWITWGSVAASLMIVVTFAILWRQGSSEENNISRKLLHLLIVPVCSYNFLGKTISLAKVLEVKEIDGRNVATNDTAGIVYQNMQEDILREEEIIYNTVITPRGTEYLLTLSDGSRVWLNSDSRLKFPVKFSKGMRRVELVGEGYFEVAKDTSSPFIVNSGKLEIKVTGTSFNIAAYPDEKIVQTTLVSGSVDVSCPECADTESVSLVPNELPFRTEVQR
ncbi:MAG: FecR family protein [Butyricimonas paravirosa]